MPNDTRWTLEIAPAATLHWPGLSLSQGAPQVSSRPFQTGNAMLATSVEAITAFVEWLKPRLSSFTPSWTGASFRAELAMILRALVIGVVAGSNGASASAQPATAVPAAGGAPTHIPARGGEVILGDKYDTLEYNREGFAPVRRSGDLLFISGIIVARRPGEGTDVESFKNEVRRTFRRIQHELEAAGANFDDVVMINSFHVWSGPDFNGTKEEQFEAFEQVKEEFMHGPHPAWTAVGSTGLLGNGGIIEVQMIAHVPPPGGS